MSTITARPAPNIRDRGARSLWSILSKRPPARGVELEELTIIPDAKQYKPGETATLLVQAPFSPGEALLSIRRSGIVSTRRFKLDGPTARVTVPITDAYTPNVYVQIDVVGAAERLDDKGDAAPQLPRRPAFAKDTIRHTHP